MNTSNRLLLSFIVLVMPICSMAQENAIAVEIDQPTGPFATQGLDDWEERSFEGNTSYELVDEGDTPVLKGHTEGQASVLYREVDIDLSETPVINWSWKIEHIFDEVDEQVQEGDDFPARLYVVVKTGFLPWETHAINYVWASNTAVGETWFNPFTDKAIMVAVESGGERAGKWFFNSRNVIEDFKTLFDIDTTEINGYAVMVDGDNSNQTGTAWFGEITFTSADPGPVPQ